MFYQKLVLSISMFVIACKSAPVEDYKSNRWVDRDTLQVVASEQYASPPQHKLESCGLIPAQRKSVSLVVGYKIKGAGCCPFPLEPVKLPEKLIKIVKSGKIVHRKYDSKNNCNVTFRIKHPDFRNYANELYLSEDYSFYSDQKILGIDP